MLTTLCVAAVLAGCPPYGPQAQWGWDGRVRNYSGWGYRDLYGAGYYPPAVFMPRALFVPIPNPWNDAVAAERARRAAQPRPTLAPATWTELESLAAEVRAAYDELRNAPAEGKAEARRHWMRARDDLERARLRAVRELRR